MKLGQLIAALRHHELRMGPGAVVVLQVLAEDGAVHDAADMDLIVDPYLPRTLLLCGTGPAMATDMAAEPDAEEVADFVDGLMTRLGTDGAPPR